MARPSNAATDTIFALSSGALPAAIAIIRISGPAAADTLTRLAGRLPEPRQATLRPLRTTAGDILDHGLLLWFPGPATVTGEDLAELHLHGGRAVVEAAFATLRAIGLRMAEPGEFTRRALLNGKMGLSEVEGLADLLAAETESQRRAAIRRADGAIARRLGQWHDRLTALSAQIEAAIDYDGEEETAGDMAALTDAIAALIDDLDQALAVAPAERLRDGVRVAIVGPPNAGKSTLFNALVGRDAAIVTDIAGTTRDAIERPVAIGGIPFVLVDTAGIRETSDPVERIGVARAGDERAIADIVIDLAGPADARTLAVAAMCDTRPARPDALPLSARTGAGLATLQARLCALAQTMLPAEGEVAFDRRYREGLIAVRAELADAVASDDMLFVAEHLRVSITRLDALLGTNGIEDMLDALFGRFCLGK